jgi:hypothetical protein
VLPGWLDAFRLRHHCHASIPMPASAAPPILFGAKVSFRTRRLLFPNPNMMLPPKSKRRGIAALSEGSDGWWGSSDLRHIRDSRLMTPD